LCYQKATSWYILNRKDILHSICLKAFVLKSIVIDPISPTVFYVALDNGTIKCFDLSSPSDYPAITFGVRTCVTRLNYHTKNNVLFYQTTVDTSNGGQSGTSGIIGFARPRRERTSTTFISTVFDISGTNASLVQPHADH